MPTTITFADEELQVIMACLNEGPHRLVRNLIDKINQAHETQRYAPAPEDTGEEAPADWPEAAE